MKTFFKKFLLGSGAQPRDYESLCLTSFGASLPSDLRAVVEAQVAKIESVERLSVDKVSVFHWGHGELPLIPNRASEATVARIVLKSSSPAMPLKCDVVFHEGRLFMLQFDGSPKLASGDNWKCEAVELRSGRMEAREQMPRAPALGQHTATGQVAAGFTVYSALPPAVDLERHEFIDSLPCTPPADYLQLLEETDGFTVEQWRFHGTNPRRIVLPKNDYLVLAEDEQTQMALCLRQGDAEPSVCLYDVSNDTCAEPETSFVKAMRGQLNL